MSQPSPGYIEKVVNWTYGKIDLARINMPLPGQFRARLALECYMLWQQNKTANVRRMVQNIAARDYQTLMTNAGLGNEEAQAMVKALGISKSEDGTISARKETEISNDIYVVNQLVGRLATSKNHIQRAMYEDNIEWLIQFGRKTGNVTAMREAQRNLEKLNNDFKDEQNPADALKPGAERNITNDISIIKPDRQNYTDDEMKQFAKQIGAKLEDVQEFIENEEGVYVPADENDEEEAAPVSADSVSGGPVPTTEPDTYDPFNQ
jgi:parvulin-like peptidyl-prolyl isomerase